MTRATRYPLLIDPQGQGRTWLRAKEAVNNMKTTALTDKHFRNYLEVKLIARKLDKDEFQNHVPFMTCMKVH